MTRRDKTILGIACIFYLALLLPNLPGALEGVLDLFIFPR